MFKAKTVDNIVSQEEAKAIIDFVKDIEPWEHGGADFWNNRSLNAIMIYQNRSKEIGKLLYDIRARVGEEIKKLYEVPEIYPDLFQVVRWFPGMEQPPHADDMTDIGEDEKHLVEWFNHREFGAIVYLNDNYDGGHTFYPNHNFKIVPKVGTLALHPGDPEHLHGVTKVENEMRYTLASFWTQDKEYFDGWVL